MNKKAETSEMNWIIAVFIYFVILITLSSAIVAIGLESQNQYNSSINDADFDAFGFLYQCTDPRYKYDATTGIKEEYGGLGIDRLFCDESAGIFSNESCSAIEGCTWTEISQQTWWQWLTGQSANVTYFCDGVINATYYGVPMREPYIGSPKVAFHGDSAGFWKNIRQQYTPFGSNPSPCTHDNIRYNKTSCDVFSCSWGEYNIHDEITSASSIRLALGNIFGFQAPFGFEDNRTFGFIVQSFLVWLPLIIFIVAFIKMLPLT